LVTNSSKLIFFPPTLTCLSILRNFEFEPKLLDKEDNDFAKSSAIILSAFPFAISFSVSSSIWLWLSSSMLLRTVLVLVVLPATPTPGITVLSTGIISLPTW